MPPLDLRHLPPPEPMQRILDALESMPPHTRLDALTPQRPEPLLPLLAQWGYAWRIQALEGGRWRRSSGGMAAASRGPGTLAACRRTCLDLHQATA